MTTTPIQIRDELIAALGSMLGNYTFSSGLTTPAVRIDDESDPFIEEPKVNGLELVITPSIEIPIKLIMGGYQETISTLISLKQWDITKDTLEAREPMIDCINSFPDLLIVRVVRVLRTRRLDNIETLSVTVQESYLVE